MMLIDFHTHIFPDKIAATALESLMKPVQIYEGRIYPPQTDGTVSGLLKSMDEADVDVSVTMPIATKPSQEESINRFAEKVNCDKIVSFGAVHPKSDEAYDVLQSLREKGFKGVKIHPEFQDFCIDSKESVRFLKKAEEAGLYVTVHAGADIGFPPPVKCTVQGLYNVLQEVRGDRIIAAHLGGFKMWDDVEKYLVGTPMLFDTAFISQFISAQQCLRIIRDHGAEKILFGSDSPWESPSETKRFIDSLGLTKEETDCIYYKNALRIIGEVPILGKCVREMTESK